MKEDLGSVLRTKWRKRAEEAEQKAGRCMKSLEDVLARKLLSNNSYKSCR